MISNKTYTHVLRLLFNTESTGEIIEVAMKIDPTCGILVEGNASRHVTTNNGTRLCLYDIFIYYIYIYMYILQATRRDRAVGTGQGTQGRECHVSVKVSCRITEKEITQFFVSKRYALG